MDLLCPDVSTEHVTLEKIRQENANSSQAMSGAPQSTSNFSTMRPRPHRPHRPSLAHALSQRAAAAAASAASAATAMAGPPWQPWVP
ncbi:hypothetical protein AAL_07594 [Moelleriella libera RCEF 2490]|uniref:Uncharacterized protein n=1 Tax=Moelleriella libera RCEF 2490 TaxID=1081109 RepID=A0A167X6U0_9HYPO|nr:hypothetical protein AAL_07594 [Moelleriella libera RCEF 2490]